MLHAMEAMGCTLTAKWLELVSHGKNSHAKDRQKNIYIHNDLANAAFHFKKIIVGRLKNDDRSGITFDCRPVL
jgi:hypothetical protein